MKVINIHHSGFAIVGDKAVVIIDCFSDPMSVVPDLLNSGKTVYVLASHRHHDHFNEMVFTWADVCSDIKYILSSDIRRMFKRDREQKLPEDVRFMKRMESYDDGVLAIHTFGSTDVGVSFMLTFENKRIFHAGDLNNWHWEKESTPQEIKMAEGAYLAVLRDISKSVDEFDVVMFPVDARMNGDYARGARQFVHKFNVRYFIPMHTWGLWDAACDFNRYKNSDFGKYVCLKEGECLSLEKE